MNERMLLVNALDGCIHKSTIKLEIADEKTCYYSEAVGNVFGIVDLSGKDGNEHLLTAYFYMEGDAKKGGNNVASMLIDYLH